LQKIAHPSLTVNYARNSLWIVLVTALLFSGCFRSRKLGTPAIALMHVNVIDATGSPVLRDMAVVISGENIASIAPSATATIPENGEVVDATGKFLIPGLVDAHVHLTGSNEPKGSREFFVPLLIANGITTVRDMGGYLESLKPLRDDIKRGKRVGPQIFFAGPYLDGSPPSFQPSLVVTNATQASEDVRTLMEQGVDFIKVQSILNRDAYFAIAATAKREHVTFVGHVPDRVTAFEASDAGQKSIEHLTGVLRSCASDEQRLMREQMQTAPKHTTPSGSHSREVAWERELAATQSDRNTARLLATFAKNRTWQVPTLILLLEDAFPNPESRAATENTLKYVPQSIVKNWEQAAGKQDEFATQTEFALREKLLARSMQVVQQMEAAGVPILAGTDSAAPYVVPGFALHEELRLLVRAGLTPMQALQAATMGPAEFLGKLETQGTIEKGKVADFVLLDADPLEDMRNIEKIRGVFVHGRLIDRTMLDEMLSSTERYAVGN
jgi:imidazolonepropionase-like amidohydrolase